MRANLDPKSWGPSAWTFLEACAEGSDEESVQDFKNMIYSLPRVLPCETCRKHSREYIETHPIDCNDPVEWLHDFKDAVSRRTKSCSCRAPRSWFWFFVVALVALFALVVFLPKGE